LDDASGSAGTSDASGGDPPGAAPTILPTVSGQCPQIASGAQGATVTFAGQQVMVWAGNASPTQHGSLLLFWHGTGETAATVGNYLGMPQIAAITGQGGLVASFVSSTGTGTSTGDNVWFTGDFAIADQVVACAIQGMHIDPRRIYVFGDSSGGLQAAWISYARSGYIAAAAALSGGLDGANGNYLDPIDAGQDPTNVPPVMAVHGSEAQDIVIINFADASASWEADVAQKGGFTIDCNTGGGHVSGPPQVSPAIWRFFEDHPFKIVTQPYPPLPSVFPSYCVIGPRAGDGGAI
jgi:poly(3-hydroxybutyrate) depolymerase